MCFPSYHSLPLFNQALQLLEIAEAYFQGEASYQLAEDLEEFINQRSHQ